DQWRGKLGPLRPFAPDAKVRHAVRKSNFTRLPLGVFTGAEGFQARKQLLPERSDYLTHRRAVPTHDQAAISRRQIHQTTKGELDGLEIMIDVRVIEFDVIN